MKQVTLTGNRLVAVALASVMALGAAWPAAIAAERLPEASFKLSAVVVAKPGAGAVKRSAKSTRFSSWSATGLGPGAGVSVSGSADSRTQAAAGPGGKIGRTEKVAALTGAAKNARVKTGTGKAEVGVDWSVWAAGMAERWFANLKALEKRSGRTFHTRRPAMIQFTCHKDGSVSNIILKQSCGLAAYDRLQIEALKKSAPFPPFPAGSTRSNRTFLQGWECHPRRNGEKEFEPASYGKNFPVEAVSHDTPVL